MAKEYEAVILGYFQFKVITRRITKKGKVMHEYIVSKFKGRWQCDCEGFSYSKPPNKTCCHLKYVLELLDKCPKFIRLEEKESDWKDLEWLHNTFHKGEDTR
jgi:hypothetical protein